MNPVTLLSTHTHSDNIATNNIATNRARSPHDAAPGPGDPTARPNQEPPATQMEAAVEPGTTKTFPLDPKNFTVIDSTEQKSLSSITSTSESALVNALRSPHSTNTSNLSRSVLEPTAAFSTPIPSAATTTKSIISASKGVRRQAKLSREIDFSIINDQLLDQEMTLQFNQYPSSSSKKRSGKKASKSTGQAATTNPRNRSLPSKPITLSYHRFFKLAGIKHFTLKGSSSEHLAEQHRLPDSLQKDLDFSIHVSDLNTHNIQQQMANIVRKCCPELADTQIYSNEQLFTALTKWIKPIEGGYKFTLNTAPGTRPIDLVFYNHLSAEFDLITTSHRLDVNLKQRSQEAVFHRAIHKKSAEAIQQHQLLWFNEELEGGLDRLLKHFHKDPDASILQPTLVAQLWERASSDEKIRALFRLLSSPDFASDEEPIWHTLLSTLFLTPSPFTGEEEEKLSYLKEQVLGNFDPLNENGITESSLRNDLSAKKAQALLQKCRAWGGCLLTFKDELFKVLSLPFVQEALWEVGCPNFRLISMDKLIECWNHFSTQHDPMLPAMLVDATYYYLGDNHHFEHPNDHLLQPLDDPNRAILALHLFHQERQLRPEIEAITSLMHYLKGAQLQSQSQPQSPSRHTPQSTHSDQRSALLSTLSSQKINIDWLSNRAHQVLKRGLFEIKQPTNEATSHYQESSEVQELLEAGLACPMKRNHLNKLLDKFFTLPTSEQSTICQRSLTFDYAATHQQLEKQLQGFGKLIEQCYTLDINQPEKRREELYKAAITQFNAINTTHKRFTELANNALPSTLAWDIPQNPTAHYNGTTELFPTPTSTTGSSIGILPTHHPDNKTGLFIGLTKPNKTINTTQPTHGLMLTPQQHLVIGTFATNQPTLNTILYPEAEVYQGEALNGQAHGTGQLSLPYPTLPASVKKVLKQLTHLTLTNNPNAFYRPFNTLTNVTYLLSGHFDQDRLTVGCYENIPTFPAYSKETHSKEHLKIIQTGELVKRCEIHAVMNIRLHQAEFEADDTGEINLKKCVMHLPHVLIDEEITAQQLDELLANVTPDTPMGKETIAGPFDKETRTITGFGTIDSEDINYIGPLVNNAPHGMGRYYFKAAQLSLNIQSENGQMIDPFLDQFEKEITGCHEKIREIKHSSRQSSKRFQNSLKTDKSPYAVPSPASTALFSVYNNQSEGIFGLWSYSRINGTVITDRVVGVKRFFGELSLFHDKTYRKMAARFEAPAEQAMLLLANNTVVIPINSEHHRICMPQRHCRSIPAESGGPAPLYFLGINHGIVEQEPPALKLPYKPGAQHFKIDASPLLPNLKAPSLIININGCHVGDYLGEVIEVMDEDKQHTLTLPHGEGILYLEGMMRARFVEGLPDGDIELLMENGVQFEGRCEKGQLIEGTTTYFSGVTHHSEFVENKFHGLSTFTREDGNQVTLMMRHGMFVKDSILWNGEHNDQCCEVPHIFKALSIPPKELGIIGNLIGNYIIAATADSSQHTGMAILHS